MHRNRIAFHYTSRMIRRRTLQDAFARLALTAMLALALLPTLGRLHAPAGSAAPMCQVRYAPAGTVARPSPDQPVPAHEEEDGCPYCPLLAVLDAPGTFEWRPALPPPASFQPVTTATVAGIVAHAGTLGPRGPPPGA